MGFHPAVSNHRFRGVFSVDGRAVTFSAAAEPRVREKKERRKTLAHPQIPRGGSSFQPAITQVQRAAVAFRDARIHRYRHVFAASLS
jgi:hypothetical protein